MLRTAATRCYGHGYPPQQTSCGILHLAMTEQVTALHRVFRAHVLENKQQAQQNIRRRTKISF